MQLPGVCWDSPQMGHQETSIIMSNLPNQSMAIELMEQR